MVVAAVAAVEASAAAAAAGAAGALFAVAELHIAGRHVAAVDTGNVLVVAAAADIREAAAEPKSVSKL